MSGRKKVYKLSHKLRERLDLTEKIERSKQFIAASNKFGKQVGEPRVQNTLLPFVDIKFNFETEKHIELNKKAALAYEQRKLSIFSQENVDAFLQRRTFVAVFAHPTYKIEFNKIPKSNLIRLYCSNINKNLLFQNKNQQMLNALPNAKAFLVQLNNQPPFMVQEASYGDSQLVLSLNLTPEIIIETMPIQRCIVFFNILSRKHWSVPQEMLDVLASLQLEPPIYAPHNV